MSDAYNNQSNQPPQNPWQRYGSPGTWSQPAPRPQQPPQRSFPQLAQLARAAQPAGQQTAQANAGQPPDDNAPPGSNAGPFSPLHQPDDQDQSAPFQPYIGAQGGRPFHEWGDEDHITRGIGEYRGGIPPGPYAPQYHDIPGLIRRMSTFWGQNGSGYVAGPALGMGMSSDRYMRDFVAGQLARAQLNHQRFLDAMQETLSRQTEELKEERDYFSIYGPHQKRDKDGQLIPNEYEPGDHGKLVESLRAAAKKYQDHAMEAALDTGDPGAVQRLLDERDRNNSDLQRTIKMHEKEQEELRKLEPYTVPKDQPMPAVRTPPPEPIPTGKGPEEAPPSGGAKPAVVPGTEQVNPPNPNPNAPPDDSVQPEIPGLSEAEPDQQTAQADQQQQQQPPGAQLAQRGDIMSDAPQPGLGGGGGTQTADAGGLFSSTPIANQGGQGAQPAAPPPAQPPAPQPSQPQQKTPYQPPPGARQHPDYGSDVLNHAADKGYNPYSIDDDAQALVNASMTAGEWSKIPPYMQGLIKSRRTEILTEMENIRNDPKYQPKPNESDQDKAKRQAEIYRELAKINPHFAGALKGYVDGDFPVPSSVRFNQAYLSNIIGYGKLIDPSFNASTYKTRYNAVQNFTYGQNGRMIVSILTGNDHVKTLRNIVGELRSIQQEGGGFFDLGGRPFGRLALDKWYQDAVRNFGGEDPRTQRIRSVITAWDTAVAGVAPEIARAQKGAAPTLDEIKVWRDNLNAANNPDVLLSQLDVAQHLFQQRFHEYGDMWKRASGGKSMADLGEMFKKFEAGPNAGTWAPAPGGDNSPPAPLSGGQSWSEALFKMSQDPTGKQPTVGGQPAGTGGQFRPDGRPSNYDTLPSGSVYTDSEGKRRRKP